MKFVIEIELGNDAMRSGRDIYVVLRDLGNKIYDVSAHMLEDKPNLPTGKIYDFNGNAIGIWEFKDS